MKNRERYLICLLVSILVFSMAVPAKVLAASNNYGVILGDKNNNYQLAGNLVITSPANNLMVKAYSICKRLELTYSYNKNSKKLYITNPNNGKKLVFEMGKKTYIYYPGTNEEGTVKTAAYKLYYDSASKSNVIHMSALRYILNYNYYSELEDTFYSDMGYKALVSYSINSYSSYDIPVTEEVINYINTKTFTTKEELIDAVRMNLIAHKTGITINTNRSVMDEIGNNNSIYNLVINSDDKNTSKDADYLSLSLDQFKQSWLVYVNIKTIDGARTKIESPDDQAALTIDVQYETTLEQERAVDSKVADIIKELKLSSASDYVKVKKIHDYIINLASYDKSERKYSAYDILISKTAVCEGYTLAAYRLFTDAGLDCRIITGKGHEELHGWNIVKVNGEWYNIDLTWDDPVTNTGEAILSYDYFLKNDNDFTDHERDPEFMTKEFLKAYPIAEESYQMQ